MLNWNRKQEDAFLSALSNLAASVAELRKENEELRAGIDALLETIGPAQRALMEEEARTEREFQAGLNSILSFDLGGKKDEA